MEQSPVKRAAVFAALVMALVGLAAYLFLPGALAAGSPRPGPGARPGRRHPAPAASPGGSQPTAQRSSGGNSGAAPDIYQWLPFTPADLASAARTTVAFAVGYGTSSYAEPVSTYLARLRPLATVMLLGQIGRAYSTPGVASARTAARQVATATAAITSLRAFGPGSITFVVAITERVWSTTGRTSQRTDYAVTLTGTGTSWQVSAIQLASVGNP
jgi:hypothetical protein